MAKAINCLCDEDLNFLHDGEKSMRTCSGDFLIYTLHNEIKPTLSCTSDQENDLCVQHECYLTAVMLGRGAAVAA